MAEKSDVEDSANSTPVTDKAEPLSGETAGKYLPSQKPCGLRTFVIATLAQLKLDGEFVAPKSPITWAYCEGSCGPPYSMDDRNRNYVTDDVLFRQMADLNNITTSDEEKKKFKTPCCVPVEYTGMWLATKGKGKVKWKLWKDAIPSRCGCR